MRFSPSSSEQTMLSDLPLEERFHYATTRMVECEEVWSLGDENGWLIQDREDKQVIPIWPYYQLANECVQDSAMSPVSVSLEHFVYGLLKQCQGSEISFEVNPAPDKSGYSITADKLYEVLEGMLESGSYFVEG